jgi:hypothetical protein
VAVFPSTKRPTIRGCPRIFYHKSLKISRQLHYFKYGIRKFVAMHNFSFTIFVKKTIKKIPSEAFPRGDSFSYFE